MNAHHARRSYLPVRYRGTCFFAAARNETPEVWENSATWPVALSGSPALTLNAGGTEVLETR